MKQIFILALAVLLLVALAVPTVTAHWGNRRGGQMGWGGRSMQGGWGRGGMGRGGMGRWGGGQWGGGQWGGGMGGWGGNGWGR